ncbi:MAG: hypothetical protein ACOYT8_04575 [Candidatus Dependentiae bacterium]
MATRLFFLLNLLITSNASFAQEKNNINRILEPVVVREGIRNLRNRYVIFDSAPSANDDKLLMELVQELDKQNDTDTLSVIKQEINLNSLGSYFKNTMFRLEIVPNIIESKKASRRNSI